jgi:hypothetical protein
MGLFVFFGISIFFICACSKIIMYSLGIENVEKVNIVKGWMFVVYIIIIDIRCNNHIPSKIIAKKKRELQLISIINLLKSCKPCFGEFLVEIL